MATENTPETETPEAVTVTDLADLNTLAGAGAEAPEAPAAAPPVKSTLAVLREQDLVDLNRVAHDGMRVRASAGAASFRRRPTLEECLQEAQEQVARLKEEIGRAVVEDRCEAIVLGCAGMADLNASLAAEFGLPVIDGVAAAVKLVEAVVGLGLGTSKALGYAPPLPKRYAGAMEQFAPARGE